MLTGISNSMANDTNFGWAPEVAETVFGKHS